MLLGGISDLNVARLVNFAVVLLIAMTIHEFAHNYIGYRMGDPTPKAQGRLTLNPLVHIYWPGWLMWVVIGFGILGSAPISEHRMRDRRWGYLYAVAAGPFSNLLLAAFVAILYRFHLWGLAAGYDRRQLIPNFDQFMTTLFILNLELFLFNLLPFFPFDGWHILRKLLPPSQAQVLERYQNESTIAIFILIALGFFNIPILSWIIDPPLTLLWRLLLGI